MHPAFSNSKCRATNPVHVAEHIAIAQAIYAALMLQNVRHSWLTSYMRYRWIASYMYVWKVYFKACATSQNPLQKAIPVFRPCISSIRGYLNLNYVTVKECVLCT
jgi:hypothetical protein